MKTVYDFTVKDRKGKDVSLKEYANEVLLIVNTATKCGFTPQYDELEKLYENYHSQGFEILDFPCNHCCCIRTDIRLTDECVVDRLLVPLCQFLSRCPDEESDLCGLVLGAGDVFQFCRCIHLLHPVN